MRFTVWGFVCNPKCDYFLSYWGFLGLTSPGTAFLSRLAWDHALVGL